jgi:hypothetical protein
VYDGAANLPVSFDVTPVEAENADEAAEADLAPLMADWAVENDLVDEDMPPPPPPSFDAVTEGEPTDEELLGSLVNFSGAFADATSDGPPSPVLAASAARGAIEGLISPSIEANFVTPGDLLLSPTLVDKGTLKHP